MLVLLTLLSFPLRLVAQEGDETHIENACLTATRNISGSLEEPRTQVKQTLDTGNGSLPAEAYFRIAEKMNHAGDYRAPTYYETATQTDPQEPCYEALYAEYLRNFRGAATPLFPQAEEHYFKGLRKAAAKQDPRFWDGGQAN